MTSIGALLVVVAIQAAAIVALLTQRTRRASADRGLRASDKRFRLIAEHAPVIIWTGTPEATINYVNQTGVEFTGLSLDQLVGDGWLNAVHPDDVDHCLRIYVPAFKARRPFLMEYRIRRADGAYRWILDSGMPQFEPDGSYSGFIGSSVDITERKTAEAQIRESQAALEMSHREIRHLAGRLIEAQDDERARIARDLHDDVSQQLAGLSIAFSGLKRRLGESRVSEDLHEELRGLQQRTLTLAQNVRHLSHDLHPTVLRHVGLVAALTTYCAELERPHGVVLTCSADGDATAIAPDAAVCLYRIAQEALRNVIAHAGARRADVRLVCRGDHAEITVTDDGKGFDAASSSKRGKGLGLVSITERAKLAGGAVTIETELDRGTRVHARIPVNGRVETDADPESEGWVA